MSRSQDNAGPQPVDSAAPTTGTRTSARGPRHPLRLDSRARRAFGCAAALVLTAALAPDRAFADDTPWKKREHECRNSMRKAEEASPELLEQCADLFAVHARLHLMGGADRDELQRGLRWIYENGPDRASLIARDGLFRLGMRVPVREAKIAGGDGTTPVGRARYNPPEAAKADQKSAEALAKAGVEELLKKRYDQGAAKLKQSIGQDPRSEFAIYNYACSQALLKKRDEAIEWLQNLADLGSDQSAERLIRARSDGDFANLRDDGDFKRITGHMKIKVVNTMGEAGEPAIANIQKMFEKLGHKDVEVVASKDKRQDPQVLFKPHAKAQVPLIADLLDHPRTRFDPTDEGKHDLVILWGCKVQQGEDGSTQVESVGPNTVDEKMEAAKRKQNEVLAKPEQAINKVDKVISTPERTYNSAEAMGKRVEGSVKKGESLFKKVEGMGAKINSL